MLVVVASSTQAMIHYYQPDDLNLANMISLNNSPPNRMI